MTRRAGSARAVPCSFADPRIFDAASTADDDTIKLRVFMRRPDDGNTIDASFSVQFYTRT